MMKTKRIRIPGSSATERMYSNIPLIQSQCSRIQRHLFKIHVPTEGPPEKMWSWDITGKNPFENLMDDNDLDVAITSLREIRDLVTHLEQRLSDERLATHKGE